jgi:hypothetical protein
MVGRILRPRAFLCQAGRNQSAHKLTYASHSSLLSSDFPRKIDLFRLRWLAAFLPFHATMTWDIALGRWLALCLHPICAWRMRSKTIRALVVTSYFAAGYGAALLGLMIRSI